MHSHLVRQIAMCFFHLVAVCLLLTCSTSASDSNKIIYPCKDLVHQYQVNISNSVPTTIKISLDDSDCSDRNFKLSLVIIKKLSNVVCTHNASLDVEYTTSQGEVINQTNWGCPSNYHIGDNHMDVEYILENTKEFTISRHGNWTSSSKVGLVAAAYFEPPNQDCGNKYFDCSINNGCSNNGSGIRRCISELLKCDDYPSCGMQCNEDEANEVCHPRIDFTIDWGNFQYIVTTFLAALFFILSPTVIVFLLFYRKRMRVHEHQRRIQLEREVRAARERSMVITISNRLNDNPPTYDDVHETKEPPPCFCAAVALSNTINQDKAAEAESQSQGTAESSEEIKYDCTCKV